MIEYNKIKSLKDNFLIYSIISHSLRLVINNFVFEK